MTYEPWRIDYITEEQAAGWQFICYQHCWLSNLKSCPGIHDEDANEGLPDDLSDEG